MKNMVFIIVLAFALTMLKVQCYKNSNRTVRSQTDQKQRSRNSGTRFPSRTKEDQILSLLETSMSSLQNKFQHLENLDKTIEHLILRIEQVDNKITDSILKTDLIIINLKELNDKINEELPDDQNKRPPSVSINSRVNQLVDQKFNDIDLKLDELKNQVDHINLNGSGKGKCETELINHVNKDLIQLRKSTEAIDKKLQYNTNLVSQNIAKVINLIEDVHEVFYEEFNDSDSVTTVRPEELTQRQQRETEVSNASLIVEIVDLVQQRIYKQNKSGESSMAQKDNPIRYSVNESTASIKADSRLRKAGLIFPSIHNKPYTPNTIFTFDGTAAKDINKGYSCAELFNAGSRQSGVYYLQIRATSYWFLKVYCEHETAEGGWTVIQRRDNFGEPGENFNRDWNEYKNGFGEPAREFWLGNENIYMLTNNEDYALRIELEDFDGNKRYAQYSHFKIHSEADYYKLEIDGYEGNAGDSLSDPTYGSNDSSFSTYNRDNDRSSLNCASMLKGGWWWKSCGRGLNGLYLHDPQDVTAKQGIVWYSWRGWDHTLKRSTMMIKPSGRSANVTVVPVTLHKSESFN